MPKIFVHQKELSLGFKKNKVAAEILLPTPSVAAGLMLLFYAVECGLKCILCARNRGSYLQDESPLLMTHDLASLVKELRLPPSKLPTGFRLIKDDKTYPTSECHLAWRYGSAVVSTDQDILKASLLSLADRIAEDIA